MDGFGEQFIHSIPDGALLAGAGAIGCPDVARTACKNLDIFSKGDILMKRGSVKSSEMRVQMMGLRIVI